MNILSRLRTTVTSAYEPRDIHVGWIDISDAENPIFKVYMDGEWKPLSSACCSKSSSNSGSGSSPTPTPSNSEALSVSCINTTAALNRIGTGSRAAIYTIQNTEDPSQVNATKSDVIAAFGVTAVEFDKILAGQAQIPLKMNLSMEADDFGQHIEGTTIQYLHPCDYYKTSLKADGETVMAFESMTWTYSPKLASGATNTVMVVELAHSINKYTLDNIEYTTEWYRIQGINNYQSQQ